MTAAVARPPLFSHLVASRPDREKGSFAATVTSVVLHGTVIAAAVVLTARVSTPKPAESVTVPIVPVKFTEQTAPAREVSRRSDNAGSPADAVAPAPPSIVTPGVIDFIPKPGTRPVEDPSGGRTYDGPVRYEVKPGPIGTGDAPPGGFVAVTKVPRLLNQVEIESLLRRHYPNILLQAGIGGTVKVWLQLDEKGTVIETRIHTTSAHKEFDEAALRIGKSARFSPAYNMDTPVKVWVEMPIVFTSR
jgi:TonB family protein